MSRHSSGSYKSAIAKVAASLGCCAVFAFLFAEGHLTPLLTGSGLVCEGGRWLDYYLKHSDNLSVKMNGRPLLTCLIERASYEDVEKLLEQGVSTEDIVTTIGVNKLKEFTPLKVAVHEGKNDIVQLLLENGAEIPEGIVEYAVTKENAKTVNILLSYGANIDGRRDGSESPLYNTVVYDNQEIFELLLDSGANPNIEDSLGRVPLHSAAGRGDTEMVERLLEAGAEPSRRTNAGVSPIDLALRRDYSAVVTLLRIALEDSE